MFATGVVKVVLIVAFSPKPKMKLLKDEIKLLLAEGYFNFLQNIWGVYIVRQMRGHNTHIKVLYAGATF